MEKYLVTVKKGVDIDQFYDDMETSGGTSTIPDREVDCYDRRPISRNTGYILSEEEVNQLKNDPRVVGIESQSLLDTITNHPCWTQTSTDWDKSSTSTNTNRNWGLYRCINGEQVSNWGSNGTVDASATIVTTSSGKNVDVVIVDGHLNINSPEFAVNDDGTGGSRVQQFNWLSLNPTVLGTAAGTYSYRSGSSLNNANDNHGQHVAGTVAGNTQGWARDANIYYMSPYDSASSTTIGGDRLFEYIRAWHNSKSVNESTGRRNPTIVNNSWGSTWNNTLRSNITSIVYRGTTYNSGFTDSAFQNTFGIRDFDATNVYIQAYITASYIADMEDAVNDGVIFVGSAGNDSTKIDIEGGDDFNNYIVISGSAYYYHRGSWNNAGSRSGVGGQRLSVCVGAVSALVNESKKTDSNCGPRVDVYAPGTNIISAVHDETLSAIVNDSRNSSYKLGKYSGTSMAGPQVCGVLACLLEQYPNMNQSDIMSYLEQHSKTNQMTTTSSGYNDDTDIQGSSNSYLFYKKERGETGSITPRYSYSARKGSTNGVKYPRVNTRVTKRV